MRILNFGSLNIDYVYRVDKFVQPGETKSSRELIINSGGKGLNQSIAAVKAGSEVMHAGLIGRDGTFLVDQLKENGVDVSLMKKVDELSGHAIIQVDDSGQNCILLYGGTNRLLTEAYIDITLDSLGQSGLVLLQNETNLVGYIIQKAKAKGLKVAFNAAPMDQGVLNYPIHLLDWLIINEVEGCQIAECNDDQEIIPNLAHRYPDLNILLTLGKRGSRCYFNGIVTSMSSFSVKAIDTTAAGDTFTGYFLSSILNQQTIQEALQFATAASALCVQRLGAASSIPIKNEVLEALSSGSLVSNEVIP